MIPARFTWYISRQFLLNIMIVLGIVTMIILLFDSLEIVRKSKDSGMGLFNVLYLVLLRLPNMIERTIPFAVLIGTVLTYIRLAKSSELVVIRAAGISVWQFLMPTLISAFLLGVFMITVFNPISCALQLKYQTESTKAFTGRASFLSLSNEGLWLRQLNPITGNNDNEVKETVLHAKQAQGTDNITINEVIIYVFGENDRFIRRIDAETGILTSDYWQLFGVQVTERDNRSDQYEEFFYRTDMSLEEIYDSLASPESVSFWQLPGFIKNIQKAGFSADRHRLHLQTLLALPVFFATMVLIGAVFSLHPHRNGKTGLLITASIMVGFFIYFLTNLLSSLGLSGSMPLSISVWTPILVSGLMAIIGLLHFEDG